MSDNGKPRNTIAADFQVHMLDLRKLRTKKHLNFSYEIMAQDVLEHCHTHNLETINIMGHSMGGKVAMRNDTSRISK
jgi:pimeloyl-ACP methyl ester carboxylesterase